MRSRPLFLVAALALTFAPSARADGSTKQACIDADTQAQTLRSDGKLVAARKQLDVCVDPACPQMVRDDCAQRIDEITRLQPSIVLSAKNGSGDDLLHVTVSLDGVKIADVLDGRTIAVDPGAHQLVFEESGTKVGTNVVVREGEKARVVFVVIDPPLVREPPPVVPEPEPDRSHTGTGQRIVGGALAGVGLVGVGLGVVFGLTASSSWSSAQNLCSPTSCPSATRGQAEDDRSAAQTKGTISTIGFVAGGALIVGGAVLYFTAPKASPVQVGLAPTLGGASLRGTF